MPNSKNTEPVRRRVLILKYLGEARRPLTAREIHARLADERVPIHVTLRTVERDLLALEHDFHLKVDEARKPHTWSYPRKQRLELPAPREEEAAARLIASDALAGRMPGWVLDLLEPMLGSARRALEESGLGDWRSRFKVIGRGPRLMPPHVDREVFRTAVRALSESRRLEADYRARGADGWKVEPSPRQSGCVRVGVALARKTRCRLTPPRGVRSSANRATRACPSDTDGTDGKD